MITTHTNIQVLMLLLAVGASLPAQETLKPKQGSRPSAFLRAQKLKALALSGDVESSSIREAALSSPLPFVPVTPCRLMDTRAGSGFSGSFGAPTPSAGSTRTLPVTQSSCGIPATAAAYSLNITVVPSGPLGYLSVWPSGSARPLVSTLNSFDGAVVANAAIVPAGANGAIDLFVTDRSDVIVDINGYFASVSGAVNFYAVTPCRVMDTRTGSGFSGAFGSPSPTAGSTRDVPVTASPCGVPASAKAYSVNVTVVPKGPLSYLTIYPTGLARPIASTLNSFGGKIVANAAIVPAGTNGSVSVFVTDATDVIVDINGYLAP